MFNLYEQVEALCRLHVSCLAASVCMLTPMLYEPIYLDESCLRSAGCFHAYISRASVLKKAHLPPKDWNRIHSTQPRSNFINIIARSQKKASFQSSQNGPLCHLSPRCPGISDAYRRFPILGERRRRLASAGESDRKSRGRYQADYRRHEGLWWRW